MMETRVITFVLLPTRNEKQSKSGLKTSPDSGLTVRVKRPALALKIWPHATRSERAHTLGRRRRTCICRLTANVCIHKGLAMQILHWILSCIAWIRIDLQARLQHRSGGCIGKDHSNCWLLSGLPGGRMCRPKIAGLLLRLCWHALPWPLGGREVPGGRRSCIWRTSRRREVWGASSRLAGLLAQASRFVALRHPDPAASRRRPSLLGGLGDVDWILRGPPGTACTLPLLLQSLVLFAGIELSSVSVLSLAWTEWSLHHCLPANALQSHSRCTVMPLVVQTYQSSAHLSADDQFSACVALTL